MLLALIVVGVFILALALIVRPRRISIKGSVDGVGSFEVEMDGRPDSEDRPSDGGDHVRS